MKTIGLACTGGGTKALSSLGVIKALEDKIKSKKECSNSI